MTGGQFRRSPRLRGLLPGAGVAGAWFKVTAEQQGCSGSSSVASGDGGAGEPVGDADAVRLSCQPPGPYTCGHTRRRSQLSVSCPRVGQSGPWVSTRLPLLSPARSGDMERGHGAGSRGRPGPQARPGISWHSAQCDTSPRTPSPSRALKQRVEGFVFFLRRHETGEL